MEIMKYIKTYKIFENSNLSIENQLRKFVIKNYTINSDGSIDVNNFVNIAFEKLNEIPFRFGKITKSFDCSNNQLISLTGSPSVVGEIFDCTHNKLTSLQYCPKYIGNSVDFSFNQLTSLLYAPLEIPNNFYCDHNELTSLEYCPSEIGENFHCSYNKLTMLDCSSYVKGNIYCHNNLFTEEPEFFGDCEGKIYWK